MVGRTLPCWVTALLLVCRAGGLWHYSTSSNVADGLHVPEYIVSWAALVRGASHMPVRGESSCPQRSLILIQPAHLRLRWQPARTMPARCRRMVPTHWQAAQPQFASQATSVPPVSWNAGLLEHDSATAPRMNTHWWKNISLVRQEIDQFCDRNALDKSVLPSTSQMRILPGGNHLINAVRRYGGIANLSKALGTPSLAAFRRQTSTAQGGASCRTTNVSQSAQPSAQRKRAKNSTVPRGYFADRERFRSELIAFGQEQTNNKYWKVLPSPSQMRRTGRMDLARAIHRYGGSTVVASRFGLLPSEEYAYFFEFYNLLRELKAYQEATGQVGCMPSLARMKRDGRPDIVRLIRKHGGQNVLAARLDLRLERERKPYLRWGDFDIDFAIDLLNASQVVALETGHNLLLVLPTEEELAALGRSDLAAQIVQFGGREDVARRLGMDSEAFPSYS